ncbi:MAG: sulfatase 1 precursor [Flavobacteriaceae bacterium]|nr:sulfatase 1 precursor [Flavobacteriaceae bacterium]
MGRVLIFGCLFFSLIFGCNARKIKPNETSPNFILILTDDQGWNGTSVQMMDAEPQSKSDYHETPNLESLAERGMHFSSAYASAPVCSPSRYSIQFGQTPARLQMIRVGMNTDHINHQRPISIPKLLKNINSNYTAAHFGKWGIDAHPSELGYDESDGITGNKEGGFDYKNHQRQWRNNSSEDPKKIFSTTKKATDFLERQANSKRPFFLQVSHYAVHSDIMMRKATLNKYQNKAKGAYQKHAGFAAMTEDLDTGLGILLKKLKALGLEKNTYIIYTSDNGAVPIMPPRSKYKKGSNFPLSRGKWDALEGGIRVPFVVAGPKILAGQESKTPITFSDLLPTLIDLAGGELPLKAQLDGGSFKNSLFKINKSKINRPSKGLIFHVPYENGIALKRAHSSVIFPPYKLIKFYDNNELSLYNLDRDIMEQNDIALSNPTTLKFMENLLDTYLKTVKAPKWKPGLTWKSGSVETINSFH